MERALLETLLGRGWSNCSPCSLHLLLSGRPLESPTEKGAGPPSSHLAGSTSSGWRKCRGKADVLRSSGGHPGRGELSQEKRPKNEAMGGNRASLSLGFFRGGMYSGNLGETRGGDHHSLTLVGSRTAERGHSQESETGGSAFPERPSSGCEILRSRGTDTVTSLGQANPWEGLILGLLLWESPFGEPYKNWSDTH